MKEDLCTILENILEILRGMYEKKSVLKAIFLLGILCDGGALFGKNRFQSEEIKVGPGVKEKLGGESIRVLYQINKKSLVEVCRTHGTFYEMACTAAAFAEGVQYGRDGGYQYGYNAALGKCNAEWEKMEGIIEECENKYKNAEKDNFACDTAKKMYEEQIKECNEEQQKIIEEKQKSIEEAMRYGVYKGALGGALLSLGAVGLGYYVYKKMSGIEDKKGLESVFNILEKGKNRLKDVFKILEKDKKNGEKTRVSPGAGDMKNPVMEQVAEDKKGLRETPVKVRAINREFSPKNLRIQGPTRTTTKRVVVPEGCLNL